MRHYSTYILLIWTLWKLRLLSYTVPVHSPTHSSEWVPLNNPLPFLPPTFFQPELSKNGAAFFFYFPFTSQSFSAGAAVGATTKTAKHPPTFTSSCHQVALHLATTCNGIWIAPGWLSCIYSPTITTTHGRATIPVNNTIKPDAPFPKAQLFGAKRQPDRWIRISARVALYPADNRITISVFHK